MRTTHQRSRLRLLLSACLLLPTLATTSEVPSTSVAAHPTTPALYTREGSDSDNRPALPTLWAGILDLSKPCQQELLQLESRLAMNDTLAFTQVAEALFSSGRVMEGLFLVNAGIETAKDAPPPTAKDQELALLNLISGFPLISLGSSDACGFVSDFQYCHVDVASIYLRFGLCVPAACNAQDIQLGLNATYHKLTKGYLDSSLLLADTTVCGNTSFPWTTGTYVMIGVCFFLLALVAAGTALEYANKRAEGEAKRRREDGRGVGAREENGVRRQPSPSLSARVLLCFSLLTNWRLLFAKARGGPFDALDGIRTLSMSWVIFGHTFIFALFSLHFMNFGTEVNGHDGKGFLASYPAQAVTGGYFAVDTFFFLSAFLAVFFMLEEIKKMQAKQGSKGGILSFLFKTPLIYILRWIRLTPTYFFVLLMYWKVLAVAEKGPFWTQAFQADYDVCETGWWANILYINNIKTETSPLGGGMSCYPVSWYLSVDFQMFLLTPFVAMLAARSHRLALGLLGLATVASIMYTWIAGHQNLWTIDLLDQSTYFEDYYIKPWTRAPAYFIGMGLAIIWFYYYHPNREYTGAAGQSHAGLLPSNQNNPPRARPLTKMVYYSLLLVSLVLIAWPVEGARSAYADNPPKWSTALMSFYIALSKPAWTLGLAVLCFLLFLGEGGPIKQLLECRAFTVASRLTYTAYLTHPAIIYWVYGDHLGPMHYSTIWYIIYYLGFLTTVLITSTLVHLLVERPVANLERLTRGGGGRGGGREGGGGRGNGLKKAQKDDGIKEPLLSISEKTIGDFEEGEEGWMEGEADVTTQK